MTAGFVGTSDETLGDSEMYCRFLRALFCYAFALSVYAWAEVALLDSGDLTALRTAAATAVGAKHLAPLILQL